jgi:hypothetical protein
VNDPPIQFRDGHKGEDQRMAQKFGIVKFRNGMILEEERNNVRINNNVARAAGSDLLERS